MCPFGVVELQRACERLEDAVGDAAEVAALEPGVVIDADAGEQRDLFPAQPAHPAVAAVHGQASPLRGDPGAPGGEETADLRPVVHDLDATSEPRSAGGSVSTWVSRHCHAPTPPGCPDGAPRPADPCDLGKRRRTGCSPYARAAA